MYDLIRFFENENYTMYTLSVNGQVFASVPKNLKGNIKTFMLFKDSILQEQEKNRLMSDMQAIYNRINTNDESGILIVSLFDSNFLMNENVVTYGKEFVKIKNIVNSIYNKLLSDGEVKKENFVREVKLLTFDSKYKDFSSWLCMQNPSRFQSMGYYELFPVQEESKKSEFFTSQNTASIFNEPNSQSTMMGMQSNIKPIEASLSIKTPKFEDISSSGGGGPVNSGGQYVNYTNQISNQKKLVKTLPHNHGNAAFIKWYTALFILLASLIIGITVSLILVK